MAAQFMTISASNLQQKQYRITLNLSVQSDFNPHQINYEKLFKLDEDLEALSVTIEDLNYE
jgi:hypothetical protein|tara:strand:- start:46636 stop:46818 length:183 start_codon:yes stop_codon:yes gene_type:complete